MATTDFDTWISENVNNLEDAYCLRQSILNDENIGSFEISAKDGKKFVKAFGETLMLASIKAKETFLSMLENRYSEDGLDIETLYDFNRLMEKDD